MPPPHPPLTSISSSLFSIPSIPHLKRLDTPPPPLSLPLFPLPSPHPTPHDLSPLRSRATRTNAKLKRTSPSPSSSFVHRVNTVVEMRQPVLRSLNVGERTFSHNQLLSTATTLRGGRVVCVTTIEKMPRLLFFTFPPRDRGGKWHGSLGVHLRHPAALHPKRAYEI